MAAQVLWIAGASIFLILGSLHLYYTFFTDRFSVNNPETEEAMKQTYPLLTRRTTMWKAWIGFNASHSSGAMFIGVLNIVLAVQYFDILKTSWFLMIFNLVTALFYLYLGKKYWFRIPFTGILISTICFLAAIGIISLSSY